MNVDLILCNQQLDKKYLKILMGLIGGFKKSITIKKA